MHFHGSVCGLGWFISRVIIIGEFRQDEYFRKAEINILLVRQLRGTLSPVRQDACGVRSALRSSPYKQTLHCASTPANF